MVFDEIVRVTREVSPMFWAVERYTGPWNKKLSNPILVIGNEADPITPYKNAKSVADALGESAVLIEQDDYGTFAALNNYFLNNSNLLEAARTRGNQLFIAVIALACATGLLLTFLIGSFVLGRKKKGAQEWAHVTREMFESAHEEQGHVYTTPYHPIEVKKAGGYAQVET
ncbi:hypothetical protein FRC10_009884 [Ceratobasidium sp. 414]|nr:hypothetical protein FRC10_009884 [Ceratobasidium sp. 414]